MLELPDTPGPDASQRWGLRQMLAIAAPSVVTMVSYTLMQFVDAMMVSRIHPVDDANIAAQFNGGLAAWLPQSFMVGLVSVVNTYVSQNLGAGTPRKAPAYAWNALWLNAMVAVLMAPYVFVLPAVFRALGHDGHLVELEMSYARILCFCAMLGLTTRTLAQFFYGMHRPMVVMIGAVVGNIVNFALNYTFVLGRFGAPALGLQGSAMSTVIGTAVEVALPLAMFLGPTFNRLYGTRAAWRPDPRTMADLFRMGWPAGLMMVNEIACWGYFLLGAVGALGEDHNAAAAIVLRYMQISFMPAVGVSFALTAVVGKCLGMNRPDLARKRANLGILATVAYMGVCGLAFVIFRQPLSELFIDRDMAPATAQHVVSIASTVLIVAAGFQLFDGVGVTITGVLRGAGDTLWPGVATVVFSWVFVVGLSKVLATCFPQWGSVGPWLGAAAYIIALGTVLGVRFLNGSWMVKRVVKEDAEKADPADAVASEPAHPGGA